MRKIKMRIDEINSLLLNAGQITLSDRVVSITVVKNCLNISLELNQEKDEILKSSIESLKLPSMVFNSLKSAEIKTVDELCSWTEYKLLMLRNLGEGGVQSIVSSLKVHNLKLKE